MLFDGVSLWCPLVGAQSNLGAHWKETLAPLISSLLPTNTIVYADIGFLWTRRGPSPVQFDGAIEPKAVFFVSMASNLMGRQRQNRCRTKQMDFGCKLFNQGRETKFWEAGELMRFSILGKQEEIFTLQTIFYHAITENSSGDLSLGSFTSQLSIDMKYKGSSFWQKRERIWNNSEKLRFVKSTLFSPRRGPRSEPATWQIAVGARWQTTWEEPPTCATCDLCYLQSRLCRKVLRLWQWQLHQALWQSRKAMMLIRKEPTTRHQYKSMLMSIQCALASCQAAMEVEGGLVSWRWH